MPVKFKFPDFGQAGVELKNKKRISWAKVGEKIQYKGQKLTNFQKKKKDFSGQKKQAGAELGQKVGEKIEYKGQKLTNLKKKDFSGQKQAWAELKKKKKIFWAKNQEKIE